MIKSLLKSRKQETVKADINEIFAFSYIQRIALRTENFMAS